MPLHVPPKLRVLRRALRGFLTRPTEIVGEVPEELRPVRRAVHRTGTRSAASIIPSDPLHLLSYNVQRAYREPEMIRTLAAACAEHSPDVLLLQEAPRELWSHPDLEPVFAGRHLFYAPFHLVDRPGGRYRHAEYGQLVASRIPLGKTRVLELPTVTRAGLGSGHLLKRIALLAELSLPDDRILRLANVHHEPFVWPAGRTPQHEALFRWLRTSESSQGRCVELCIGDFNATFGVHREPGLADWWAKGFEAALPRGRHLDNALARGHRGLRATHLRERGSDHRPLLVEVEVHPGRG